MDLLTTADLKALAEPIEHGPAVSLFMPTHRAEVMFNISGEPPGSGARRTDPRGCAFPAHLGW